MAKQIYVNVPVTNLAKATTFYEALGFVKQPDFSNEYATGLKWSDEIFVMLLTHDFYKKFLKDQHIADTTQTNSALLALSLDSKEAVQKFAETAKQNGGDYYQVDMGTPENMMFGLEVLDPDGNHWEPVWMNSNFNPHG
jgi:predicted lactoylglutathione lyase